MCGLAGFIDFDGKIKNIFQAQKILKDMGDQIAHRGPDDEKYFVSENIGMVFRRLSIIDLDNGHQPFVSDDESIVLMVNGEIYNYKELRGRLKSCHGFKSSSDCEVILHLYREIGEECFNYLNGMYAIALYDKSKQLLYLVRDHLGVKPLYYHVSSRSILFSSEEKSIRQHPDYVGGFCWESSLSYKGELYSFGKDKELTSFFKNINLVDGGACIRVNLGDGSISNFKYWDFDDLMKNGGNFDYRDRDQLVDHYRFLVEDSVKRQLVSDVEVGIFLSGGIDSVVISLLASQCQALHTFTVLSQSTYGNGDAPEAHYAASSFGLPNHQVLFDWHDPGISSDDWKYMLWLLETPFANAEQLYKYQLHQYAKSVRPDLKVILLGQGSDEFNGGYCCSWLDELNVLGSGRNWDGFMNLLSQFEIGDMANSGSFKSNRYVFTKFGSLLSKEYLSELSAYPRQEDPWHIYLKRNRNMLQMYNLWHEDRTAAGNSIENRVPYLDHRIVEFLVGIPPKHYESLFWDKSILREAFKRDLPDRLALRKKVPFFNGVDLRYTERMMYRILSMNNAALLEEVMSNDRVSEVLNRDALWSAFTKIKQDPEYKGVSVILELVNMGLMDAMSQSKNNEVYRFSSPVKKVVEIQNWSDQSENIELALSERKYNISLSCIIVFSKDTFLMSSIEQVDALRYYIVVGTQIKYKLDSRECENWIKFLKNIDGKRSIASILGILNISAAKIMKELEEALDYNIVELIDMQNSSGGECQAHNRAAP